MDFNWMYHSYNNCFFGGICNQYSKNKKLVNDELEKEFLQQNNIIVTKEYCEYSVAAEPPVRCGESHQSGLTEPPCFCS